MRPLILFLAILSTASARNFVRVCYYTNWSQYRPAEGKFLPEDIDPALCTHLVYAFAKINTDNKIDFYEKNDNDLYTRFNALKQKNSELRTLLAVGGWSHEEKNSPFSKMVKTAATRKVFIDSVLLRLKEYKFDGLDLDWEYPAVRGGSPRGDKQKFTILCKELLEAFKTDAAETGKPRFLLTAAVGAGKWTVDQAYEIDKLGPFLDILNLMTYDLHGNWESKTGHHTAMGPPRDQLTVSFAVKYWISKGFPANKIALGMGTYGRSFGLQDPNKNGLGTAKSYYPKPEKGPYTGEHGFLAYYEICTIPLTIVHDNAARAPYGYHEKRWVGFDDEYSLNLKVEELIKGKGLAGAMFWALPLDDFKGHFCKKGRFPLINAVKKYLGGYIPPPRPTEVVPPTTMPQPTTMPSGTTKPGGTHPPTQGPTNPPSGSCVPVPPYDVYPGMDTWCISNCALGNCPSTHCKC